MHTTSGSRQNRQPPKKKHIATQYLLLVYTDETLLGRLSPGEFDTHMRECLLHADELQARGALLGYQQPEQPAAVRRRVGA